MGPALIALFKGAACFVGMVMAGMIPVSVLGTDAFLNNRSLINKYTTKYVFNHFILLDCFTLGLPVMSIDGNTI